MEADTLLYGYHGLFLADFIQSLKLCGTGTG